MTLDKIMTYLAIALASFALVWVLLGIVKVGRQTKELGMKFDSTAAKKIAGKQLKDGENLLYCIRKDYSPSHGITSLVFAFILFAALYFFAFYARSHSGAGSNTYEFKIIIFATVFLAGTGLFLVLFGCKLFFDDRNVYYYVTDKRLCVRKAFSSGKKDRDVLAEQIKQVGVYYETRTSKNATGGSIHSYEKGVEVWTHDWKIIILNLFEETDRLNMIRALLQMSGLTEYKANRHYSPTDEMKKIEE